MRRRGRRRARRRPAGSRSRTSRSGAGGRTPGRRARARAARTGSAPRRRRRWGSPGPAGSRRTRRSPRAAAGSGSRGTSGPAPRPAARRRRRTSGGERGWVFWSSRSTGTPSGTAPSQPSCQRYGSMSARSGRITAPGSRSGGRGWSWRRRCAAGPSSSTTWRRSTTACTACMPVRASGSTVGESRPGSRLDHLVQRAVRRVQHQVALVAGRDHALHHHPQVVGDGLLGGRQVGPHEQHRLRLEQLGHRAQAVLAQRLAARDQVDDRLGGVQPRRQLDRAVDRDDLHVDALAGEERRGGDAGRPWRRGCRRGRRRAAPATPRRRPASACSARSRAAAAPGPRSRASMSWLRPAIAASTAPSCGPDRDVVGAREQHLDVPLRAVRVQRAAGRLDLDAAVAGQPRGGLVHAALGRQGEAERPAHGLRRLASRSSTIR